MICKDKFEVQVEKIKEEGASMKKLCFFVLLFSVTFLNGQAFAEILFSDNFDSYATGSPPGDGWIENQVGGDVLVDSTGFSGKSVRIQRTDFTGGGISVYFGHYHREVNNQVTYEVYFRSSTVTSETLVMYGWRSSNSKTGPWVSVGGISGQLANYDGSWHSITPISANTWYHVKIVAYISSNTFDVYVDDMNTPIITGCHFRDSGLTGLDSFWFQVFKGLNPPGKDDLAYVDNVSASASALAVSSVPTLTEWGMVSMSVLLGGCGIYLLRRRRAV